ncbi:PAS domain-containing sensor histidine kinase [Methanosphaerula palustris]|uniref:histidine kinase n=1 Tax=Methanosphaerula palustris (strain ATCC BAA-1556 / DSM 19958 / E1-9c) TaxID=521011 RepID=B8GJD1_METPE|nr:PAS domain S-box protein [Methanosphaerula palustris]ACL16972.1 PAS/PAC sensor signal transduction histidine kinase [Methanosphaerula palustris E1-9c]
MKQEMERLRQELEDLRSRNRELEETLDAIQSGEVDAIVVSKEGRKEIYTLEGADHLYRVLVEKIQEGALTLTVTGMILYANTAFVAMRRQRLSAIIGTSLRDHIAPRDRSRFDELLTRSLTGPGRGEMLVCSGAGSFPVLVSMTPIMVDGSPKLSVVISDRKEDYDRLHLQSRMLDAVADAVIATDPAGRIIYWNWSATRTYGWKEAEAMGQSLNEAVVRELSQDDADRMAEQLGSGNAWSGEFQVHHRDGHLFPIHVNQAPVFDEDGEFVAVIGTSHDISERKAIERALAESEAEARSFMDNMVDACAICETVYSPDGKPIDIRLVEVNAALAQELGRPAAEIAGWTAFKIRPELTLPWFDRFLEVHRTGAAMQFEEPFPVVGRWYRIAAFPVRGGRVAVVFHNITERKQAEEALAESEDRYRSLVEKSIDAVLLSLPDGSILAANAGASQIFGMTEEELIQAGRASLIDESDPRFTAAYEERARTGRFSGELTYRRKDGTLFPGEVTSALFTDRNGAIMSTMIIRDITKRKEIEESLKIYSERLQVSNEELQRFAYIASHDLQAPLRSIVSFSQLLDRRYRGKFDKDADDYIRFIVDGGVRMQNLIKDLLLVSRIETQVQSFAPTDARTVVADTIRSLETLILEIGAVVTVDPLPIVMADPPQLEQVFTNLIGNAIKYRRPEVPVVVWVSAVRQGGWWEFAVRDNGIGIEPEYFDQIFEMFSRLQTKDEYEGTGIGLAIVRKIVARHGGKIWVESTPGKGSIFHFTLPGESIKGRDTDV